MIRKAIRWQTRQRPTEVLPSWPSNPGAGSFSLPRSGTILLIAFWLGPLVWLAHAATVVWDGEIPELEAVWSVDRNWYGGDAPSPGDSLVFGTSLNSNNNDFPDNTPFASITFTNENWDLSGNALELTNSGLALFWNQIGVPARPNVLEMPIAFTGAAVISNAVPGGELIFANVVDNGGNLLTVGDVAGGQVTMASTVTGAGGLTKSGSGLLLLQSGANDYAGDTVVAMGTLALAAHNAIPADSGKGNVVVDGTLDLQGTVQTFNGLSGMGIITNSSGTRAGLFLCAKDVSAIFTFDGYIGGAMNLSKIRANPILVLTRPNTYMGFTTNHDGTLRIGADNALPPATFLTIGSGTNDAQFDLAGFNQQIAGLATDTSGVATITNSADSSDSTLTFSNQVGRSLYKGRIVDRPLRKVSLTMAGGTLTLNQPLSTYRGLTLVTNSGSELIVWTGPTGAGPFSVANGATLGVTLSAANDTLNMSALTLGSSSTDTETLAINLNSFGHPTNAPIMATSLSTHGTVTINVAGAKVHVGQFPLIKHSGAIGGDGFGAFALGTLPPGVTAELVDNGGNLSVDLKVTAFVGSLVWSGETNHTPANAWDIGVTKDWLDVISNTPSAYRENTVSGPLVLFDDGASNGVVNVTGVVKPFSVTINNSNLNYTIGGVGPIAGNGTLVKDGPGSVTLTSSNSYTGDTTINGGTIQLGANGAIPGGNGYGNVSLGGTLDVAGVTETINGLSGTGLVDNTTGNGVLAVGGNDQTSTFTGIIQNFGGTLSLTKVGAGMLTLSGTNTYSGATKVVGGTLAIAVAGQPGGPLSVGNGATLSLTSAGGGNTLNTASLLLGNGGSDVTTNIFSLGISGNPINPLIYATNLAVNGVNHVVITGTGFTVGEFALIAYQGAISGSGYSFSLDTLPTGLGAYLSNAPVAVLLVITNPATFVWTGNQNADWDINNSLNWQLNGVAATYEDGDTTLFDSRGATKSDVNLTTNVAPGGVTVDTAANDYTFSGLGSLIGGGGLTKVSAGTLTLNTSNSFTGATLINGGTLKLGANATIGKSSSIVLASNTVLDASALSAGLIVGTTNISSSLGGYGSILGPVTVASAASLLPGGPSGILTFSDNLTLQGNATLRITKTGKVIGGNKVIVNKQLTFSGPSSLTVLYSGDTLVGGETFKLFDAQTYDGEIYSSTLPPLGPGLNWALNRLNVDGTIAVNRPPSAGALAVQTLTDLPVYVNVADLLALSSEPEGERLTLVSVGMPFHGTATLDSDCATLIYTPDAGYNGPDQFTYTISDEHGGLTIGTNLVQVSIPIDSGYNRFSLPVPVGGKLDLTFKGFPGETYTIQRSTDLLDWIDILTQVTPTNGLLTFQDAILAPQAFYRAVFPLGTGQDLAGQIIAATGVKGGFVTHVGCENGELTAALQRNLSYRVQGLDQSAANVDTARQYIMSLGIYGYVSADHWDGAHLPYIDNFVNLAVVQDMGTITTDEVKRVLAPLGVAYIQQGSSWTKIVKPRPSTIDDWTHFAYDATGVCVAQDTEVGPPKRYQWLAGPRFNRHHDVMSSFNAGVVANGRLFHVMDEGSRESIFLPAKWSLIARDGFNGTLLWTRPISSWHPSLYGLKSGPTPLTRRLVAIGDVVYVTLDYYGPVVALDAATGATLQTYNQTAAAEEIYWSEGTLFVVVDPNPKQWSIWESYYNTGICMNTPNTNWNDHPRIITAVDAKTGQLLWTNSANVYPTSVAVDSTGLVFHDGVHINKLDRNDGHQLWQSSTNIPVLHPTFTANGLSMILYSNTVLMAGGPGSNGPPSQNQKGFIWSVDSGTGQVLAHWPHGQNSHLHSPNDLFAFNGFVWSTAAGSTNPICTAYNPRTGAVSNVIDAGIHIDWIHERCYRSKATVNYFLTSRACLEVISTHTNWGVSNDWVRAACLYGFIPANGFIYTTPNDCSCQFTAKLTGLGALSADTNKPPVTPDKDRLEQGPAYGKAVPANPTPDDWPIYRHDMVRSGYTTNAVSSNLSNLWQTSLGGKLSSVTVAEGSVFVASVDTHTVYSLNADTGAVEWSYTAGGRVDSPPSIYQGRALFGSADGYIYCLRASDGALIWRYLAATSDLRHMSYEQVESVWPVNGSVLLLNDRVYAVSGRSMYLDGGCRFLALNPTNGVLLVETNLDDKVPGSTESLTTLEKEYNAPVALADLLSSDGQHIFMKSQWFDLNGIRTNISPISANAVSNAAWANQIGEGVHLFTPTGFLDDSWMHRTYWVWGKSYSSGAGGYYIAGLNAPCGQILCIDESNVYGFGRMLQYYKWTLPKENMLFSTSNQNNFYLRNPYNWTNTLPFFVRAMVIAQDKLFLVGPPELEEEEQSFSSLDSVETQADLASQDAALHGSLGGQLRVVDKTSGNTLFMQNVDFLPVWDGMAASRQSLYLATRDGRVVCMR